MPGRETPAPSLRAYDRATASTDSATRLVIASNRVGYRPGGQSQGGLAVALGQALEQAGGLWFGWNGEVCDDTTDTPTLTQHDQVTLATVALSTTEHEQYYNGFSNGALWPVLHGNLERARVRRDELTTYRAVNHRFARVLYPLLQPEDVVWVHDYHLMGLASELRHHGALQPMGFFLHTPFPAPEAIVALPEHAWLITSLLAFDLIGFQTERDRRAFQRYITEEAGGQIEKDGQVHAFGHSARCIVAPVGIDMAGFAALAHRASAQQGAVPQAPAPSPRRLIVGVDRLDYTKGLALRFEAFERYLSDHPKAHRTVSMTQIAPLSRESVSQYATLRDGLSRQVGALNGCFADVDWTPLTYLNHGYPRDALAGLYRQARVGLVTPLRDGMNLVAKEYVAAQDPRNPGVLVLSRFAGAAVKADGALLVNPYDTGETASALHRALEMSCDERIARWESLVAAYRHDDAHRWLATNLRELYRLRIPSNFVAGDRPHEVIAPAPSAAAHAA